MPFIDFGKALSGSVAGRVPAPDASPVQLENNVPCEVDKDFEASRFRSLSRSDWLNIIFATGAIMGGLFCASYFFNGPELLHAAARWPREFLYAQPVGGEQALDRSALAASVGLPAPSSSAKSNDRSGDPFSRAGVPLNSLNPPHTGYGRVTAFSAVTSPGIPGATSQPGSNLDPSGALSNLGNSAPGGDKLSNAFKQEAENMQQAKKADDKRTVVVTEEKGNEAGHEKIISSRQASHNTRNGVRPAAQRNVRSAQSNFSRGHRTERMARKAGGKIHNSVASVRGSHSNAGRGASGLSRAGGLSGHGGIGARSGPDMRGPGFRGAGGMAGSGGGGVRGGKGGRGGDHK